MDVSELKFMLKDLDSLLASLGERIKENHNENHTLQPLSFAYTSEDKGFVAPFVLDTLEGQEAGKEACKIIMDYYRSAGQPRLSVHRAIGSIRVSESCIEIVNEINDKKDVIKQSLTKLPRRTKASLIKNTAPNIVLKELYRHIHVAKNPTNINPSWIVSGSSTTLATAAAIAPIIHDKIADVEGKGGDASHFYNDLELIKSYNTEYKFHIKRQTRPHIRYNVKIEKSWKPIPAHLPLLYVGETEATYKSLEAIENIRDIEQSISLDDVYLIKWLGILK